MICLQEGDDEWADHLEALHDRYPHRRVVPRPDNFGAAVFSRRPARFETIDLHGVPLIRAAVDADGGDVVLFNAHVMPPAGERLAAERNRQLALLAELADLDGRSLLDPASLRPVVVCGDLNCSPWSPYFADLLERGRLTDPRAGGRTPTSWRSGNPLFALPIDHLLPGGSARVTGLAAGPDVGSDHRPLRATVTWEER